MTGLPLFQRLDKMESRRRKGEAEGEGYSGVQGGPEIEQECGEEEGSETREECSVPGLVGVDGRRMEVTNRHWG